MEAVSEIFNLVAIELFTVDAFAYGASIAAVSAIFSFVVPNNVAAAVALKTSEFKFALIVASLLVRLVISVFKLLVIVASASVRLVVSVARSVANTFSALVALVTSEASASELPVEVEST